MKTRKMYSPSLAAYVLFLVCFWVTGKSAPQSLPTVLDGWTDTVKEAAFLQNSSNSADTVPSFRQIGLLSDLKINDAAMNSWCLPEPAVALAGSGYCIIVWSDTRTANNPDIYAQALNKTGSLVGGNFRVNSNTNGSQLYPAIAMDGNGNFVVVWQDDRDGQSRKGIYAQRYSSSGAALGNNFRVDENKASGEVLEPAVAMSPNGSFIVVWPDGRSGSWSQYQLGIYDVFAQRYNANGTKTGTNFKVNSDPGMTYQRSPAIAMDANGNFVVVWEDWRESMTTTDHDIYGQRYNSAGSTLWGNFLVNGNKGTEYHGNPVIAMTAAGSFVVAWEGSSLIACQRYGSDGSPVGSNFKVNDPVPYNTVFVPTLALDNEGNGVAAWADRRNNGISDIYAQYMDNAGVLHGANFRINSDVGTTVQEYPKVGLYGTLLLSTWNDNRLRSKFNDVYAAFMDISSVATTDTVATPSFMPAAGAFASQQTITITCATPQVDIRYTTNGADPTLSDLLYTIPITLSSTTMLKARAFKTGWQVSPVKSGLYTIVLKGSISGRVLDYQGNDPLADAHLFVTGNLVQQNNTDNQGRYQIAEIPFGTSLTVQPKMPGLFFLPTKREYTPFSTDQVEQNFIASRYGDVSGNDDVKSFDASMVLRYVVGLISWKDLPRDSLAADVSGDGTLKSFDASLILRYSAGLVPKFPVETDFVAKAQVNGAGSGRQAICFGEPRLMQRQITIPICLTFAQEFYSADLTLSFNANIARMTNLLPSAAFSEFQFVHRITEREIHIAMAGKIAGRGPGELVRLGFELVPGFTDSEFLASLALHQAYIDEFQTVIQLANPAITSVDYSDLKIRQNYPNPFNASTVIRYNIPPDKTISDNVSGIFHGRDSRQNIRISIVDLLGKEVKILFDGSQSPGEHQIQWNGAGESGARVASGLYYASIRLGNRRTNIKLVVMQ